LQFNFFKTIILNPLFVNRGFFIDASRLARNLTYPWGVRVEGIFKLLKHGAKKTAASGSGTLNAVGFSSASGG